MSTEPISSSERSTELLHSSEIDEVEPSLSSTSVPEPNSLNSSLVSDGESEAPQAKPSIETIPQHSAAQRDLRAQIDEVRREMGELQAPPSSHDDLGLLPPEEESANDEDELLAKSSVDPQENVHESIPPKVPSLGLDAVGDSQSPQPVSLTPAPKAYVEQTGSEPLESDQMGDSFESTVHLTSLPPADLDLIAHSPRLI